MPYQNVQQRIFLAVLAGVLALTFARPIAMAADQHPRDEIEVGPSIEPPTEPDMEGTPPPPVDIPPVDIDQPVPEPSLPTEGDDQLKPTAPPEAEPDTSPPPEENGTITTPPTSVPSPPPGVLPELPEAVENVVDSGEALAAWIENHAATGGTIYLGADIDWSETTATLIWAPITIDTGPYTITIGAGKRWDFRGPISCVGDAKVFYASSGSHLTLYQESLVRVTGDGSVAVELESGAELESFYGQVEAHGSGAVALYAQGNAVLANISLLASGTEAFALRCMGDADLTYCTLRSDGVPISAGGAVLLDTSAADPQVPDAQVLMRTVQAPPLREHYMDLGSDPDALVLPDHIRYQLTAPARPVLNLMVPCAWDRSAIVPTAEGDYYFSATCTQPHPETGLVLPDASAVCYVLDPDRPRLIGADIHSRSTKLRLYGSRTSGPPEVYYSVDGRKTWGKAIIISSTKSQITLDLTLMIEQTTCFYIEETSPDGSLIRSNLLEVLVNADGTFTSKHSNGDYDGGDAGGGGSPEPPFGWEDAGPSQPENDSPGHVDAPPYESIESMKQRDSIPSVSIILPAQPVEIPPEPEKEPLAVSEPPTEPSPTESSAEPLLPSPAIPEVSVPVVAPLPTWQLHGIEPIVPEALPPPLEVNAATPSVKTVPPATAAPSDTTEPTPEPRSRPPVLAGILVFLLLTLSAVIVGLFIGKRTGQYRPALLILYCLLVVLATIVLFLLKMQYDNKYASARPQASSGILDLTAGLDCPLLFLWDGWTFYDGAALSPEEIETAAAPSRTIYLGEFGDFRTAQELMGNAATYRLVISVPEDTGPYALELPHIFGRYRLWVNGTLVDSHAAYFSAVPDGGRIDLVLAVEDDGSLYSGLTYPPAFGTPDAVWLLLFLRGLLAALAVGCALFLALLYLCVGVRTGRKSLALAFALLCLCYIGTVSRVLIQTAGIQTEAWYIICRVCYYGVFAALMSIFGEICGIHRTVQRAAGLIGISFCVWALVFQIWGGTWGGTARQFFSLSIGGYKVTVAAFLITAAGLSAWRRAPRSLPLLTGSLFFAAALLADRLYTQYEPALIHWPVETGALFQVGAIAADLIADAVHVYQENLQLDFQRRAILILAEERERQYNTLAAHLDAFAETRHEIRGTLLALKQFSEVGDLAAIVDLVDRSLGTTHTPIYTGNHLIDSILSVCCRDAQEQGVSFHYEAFSIPAELPIRTLDLTTVLTNLLQNALDACAEALPGTERRVDLMLRCSGQALEIDCVNTCPRPVKFRDGLPVSTKADPGHGIGLRLLKQVVEQYDGVLHFSQEQGMLRVILSLSLPVDSLNEV